MTEIERMQEVNEFQDEMGSLIQEELESTGLTPTLQWGDYNANDHVLEVIMPSKKEYELAMEIMRFECPTEASSLFGIPDDESGHLLVFQFDRI